MMPILRFLSSQTGRVVRVLLGLVLIVVGVSLGGWWWLLAIVGLVPVAAGVFDFCTMAPLFHQPFSGRRFREANNVR